MLNTLNITRTTDHILPLTQSCSMFNVTWGKSAKVCLHWGGGGEKTNSAPRKKKEKRARTILRARFSVRHVQWKKMY